MSQFIEVGKVCVYIGPGHGRLIKHVILEAKKEHVLTWSKFQWNEVDTPGYSWLGDRDTFCKHFRPVLPSEL